MKTTPRLDYLFEADFSDGTTYYQGVDDESLAHPKDAKGNGPAAYRDVLDRLDEVLRFRLVGPAGRYEVDLTNGLFSVNGISFYIERPDIPLTDITLKYLRYVNVESTRNERGRETDRKHYVSRYVLGYTAKQGAKEVSHCIAIKGKA